jgi:hypothetical protein
VTIKEILVYLVEEILDPLSAQSVEDVFTCICLMFKYLQRQLVRDFDNLFKYGREREKERMRREGLQTSYLLHFSFFFPFPGRMQACLDTPNNIYANLLRRACLSFIGKSKWKNYPKQ